MVTPVANTTSSPFTRAAITALRTLYPEDLADKSFDNTGLLLEAPFNADKQPCNRDSILLTIDLTNAVADEAIARNDSLVVAYHPIIFRGLKSLTLADSQQRSLLRLAAAGISVYCPHTAVDSAKDGMADWLADVVTGEANGTRLVSIGDAGLQIGSNYNLQHYPLFDMSKAEGFKPASIPHSRCVIHPKSHYDGAGMGRRIDFSNPRPLSKILDALAAGLGGPSAFLLATPQGTTEVSKIQVKSAALCNGSGGSVISGANVDLLITGEMSHHEALAAIENGKCVMTVCHSNSERGFLRARMSHAIQRAVEKEWHKDGGTNDVEVEVAVSEMDRDPYGFVVKK